MKRYLIELIDEKISWVFGIIFAVLWVELAVQRDTSIEFDPQISLITFKNIKSENRKNELTFKHVIT